MRRSSRNASGARQARFGRKSAAAGSRLRPSARLTFEPLEPRLVLDAGLLVLSEFMADNNNTLPDEDGDSSDWIEIYNPSGISVDLDGWHLTDDDSPNEWDKWTFPEETLDAGGYLVVFASGKDRAIAGSELHTNFALAAGGDYLALVDPIGTVVHEYAPEYPNQLEDISYGVLYDVQNQTSFVAKGDTASYLVPTDGTLGLSWIEEGFPDGGWNTGTTGLGFGLGVPDGSVTLVDTQSTWRYLDDGSNQGTAWRQTDFDDTAWSTGQAQLGYGDGDENTVVSYGPDAGNKYITTYFRREFNLQNAWQFSELTLNLMRDDGAVVYLNGQEILPRSNMPTGAITYTTLASSTIGGAEESTFYPYVVDPEGILAEGKNVVAVEIHQGNSTSSDISFDLELIGTTSASELIETDVQAEMLDVNLSSIYLRIPFTVADPEEFTSLYLRTAYDDGYVAYLNGVEVANGNAPALPLWNSTALTDRPIADSVQPEGVDLTDDLDLLVVGNNVLAVHAMNDEVTNPTFLILPELIAQSSVSVQEQYFTFPTPNEENVPGVLGIVGDTQFSVDRGFYDQPFYVEITTSTPGAEIRYTLDGSEPTSTYGTVYTTPIYVAQTTTLRAAAYRAGYLATNVDAQTYIFLDQVIQQPANPSAVAGYYPVGTSGYWPQDWVDANSNSVLANYQVDPDIVNDLRYVATIKNDLLDVPTISIVTDQFNLFDQTTGIYANPGGEGAYWERPASVEMFDGSGQTMFQENVGLRIQGGASRWASNKKHSFRLLFKSEYGAAKLNYSLFGEEAVDKFDTITLRAGFNDVWPNNGWASYLQDRWAAKTQLAMGGAASHGSFVHLYVNGLYWGMYNPVERPDDAFASSYLGGDKDDYDVYSIEGLKEGTWAAWDQLWNLVNASPIDYAAVEQMLDITAFTDYLIVNQFGGNWDWPQNNWWATYNHEAPGQWHWHSWDAEGCISDVNANRVNEFGSRLGEIYQRLRGVDEFRLDFADRVQLHLLHGGALTPQANIDRLDAMAAEIDRAIVGESARWGDGYDDNWNPPRSRDDWLSRIDWLRTQYFPQRNDIVLDQYRTAGLYPEVNPPEYNQHGGQVPTGFDLTMDVTVSLVYDETVVLPEFTTAQYFVPTDDALGTTWTEWGFNDGTWGSGLTGIGYENSPADYALLINTPVRPQDTNPSANSVFLRIPFSITELDDVDQLTLRMKYDDGYVAYINGQEVARKNITGSPPSWNSTASNHGDNLAVVFEDVDIPFGQLVQGANTNVLAIHGLNTGTGSTDMLFLPELVVGTLVDQPPGPFIYYTADDSDPRAADGSVSPEASLYVDPVSLSDSGPVKSRTLFGGEWSALNEADFFVDQQATAEHLVISELNYNPHDPTAAELATQPPEDTDFVSDDFEFIELQNVSGATIDLTGVRFVDGIEFDFAAGAVDKLDPGQFVVVVANQVAFAARYDTAGILIAGEFADGSLNGDGETIELIDWLDEPIVCFDYNDSGSWPGRPDGKGATLELIDPAGVPTADPERTDHLEDGDSWQSSVTYGGTPGMEPVPNLGIVVNEVLTHTDLPDVDAIELLNISGGPVNLGGWYLSDSWGWESSTSNGNYKKFRIPDGTVIPTGEYLVFDEDDFNPTPQTPGPYHFALDGAYGDDVWLMKADASGTLTHFADHAEFTAAALGESLGRWPNGTGGMFPMTEPTLGMPNAGPEIGLVVISEVHYNPGDVPGADDLEFVEIYNTTDQPVDLTHWRLRKAVDFDFPDGTTLAANGTMVIVAFDPADVDKRDNFLAEYPMPGPVAMTGGYSGQLSNGGERLQLLRPDAESEEEPGFFPGLLEDEVRYDDEGLWPVEADGWGDSLNRRGSNRFPNAPENWKIETPSPGEVVMTPEIAGRYVFYNNSSWDDNNPGANDDDDFAIATDKKTLLPQEAATFANYTSYGCGINGIMVDVADLALEPTALDFSFRVGNDEDPTGWAFAPAPVTVAVRDGDGQGNSDRVTIIWADHAIRKQWLQVTVLADRFDLESDDVFYFGNAVGEAGNATDSAQVTTTDLLLARNNPRNFINSAGIDFAYDFNRDQRVNSTDVLLARNNATNFLTELRLIEVPDIAAAASPAAAPDALAAEVAWLYANDQIGRQKRSSQKHDPAQAAVDMLLATW